MHGKPGEIAGKSSSPGQKSSMKHPGACRLRPDELDIQHQSRLRTHDLKIRLGFQSSQNKQILPSDHRPQRTEKPSLARNPNRSPYPIPIPSNACRNASSKSKKEKEKKKRMSREDMCSRGGGDAPCSLSLDDMNGHCRISLAKLDITLIERSAVARRKQKCDFSNTRDEPSSTTWVINYFSSTAPGE